MKKQSDSANEKLIREAYRIAEMGDGDGFAALFAEDGYFWDVGSNTRFHGRDIGLPVYIFAKAFSDYHRELIEFYTKDDENFVTVELRLQGTHDGPLNLPIGSIPPSGKRMDVPCCDLWQIENGKIKSFHCYNFTMVFLKEIGAV